MIIKIVLIFIILLLIVYIIRIKRELKSISKQIEESKGEYINIHTNAINDSIEILAKNINYLYDNSQKILAKNKKIENELRQSISNISHDLRTPLTSIKGYVQLIKEDSITDKEKNDYINIVEKRVENLQNLITSFYDLSRIHGNEFKFNLKKINLKTILCDSIAMYYNNFIEKNIEPVIEIDEKIQDIISDESVVERIFSNLIGNMLKYADKNIKISLFQEENYIISKFQNLAPNLKEEDMDKLFDRFYTSDKSRSDKNTGLGLAITKSLLDKLNNKIEAKLINGNLIIEIKWNI
ncbi:MAG: sensor histidine kinase [Clostridium sp.]|nr:HAMP domain-containing histidine kinase [Clostridium sp.]